MSYSGYGKNRSYPLPARRAPAVREKVVYVEKPVKRTNGRSGASRPGPRKATKKKESSGAAKAFGSTMGALAGEAVGGPLGAAAGGWLGGKAGELFSSITGFGDYSIAQNSLMRGGMSTAQIVNSSNKGGVIVRHCEYVGEVNATNAFTAVQYPLNPGLRTSFPWLSQIAVNFDQYRWRGLIWGFRSTSSDAVLSTNSSTSLGSVNLATDYDASDAPFTNKREMLNTMFANSTKPSCNLVHPIECKTSQSPMRLQYVRGGAAPTNTDIKMYDLGNFYVATEGMQNITLAQSVGELWVTYEVEFFKQQVQPVAYSDNFKISAAIAAAWLGPADNLHPGDPKNSIGGRINTAGTSYIFPATAIGGKYLFTYSAFGTVPAVLGSATTGISVSNGVIFDIWIVGSGTIQQSPAATANSSQIMVQFVVNLTGQGCIVSFGNQGIPTGTVIGNLVVTFIDQQLTDFT